MRAINLLVTALLSMAFADTAAFADSHHKFPGKGSSEAFNNSCDVGNKANEYSKKGDYETAIKLDREAISIYPYDSLWYHNLGVHLEKLGRYDEARKAQEQAIALEPGYVGAWLAIGISYEHQRKLTEAEKYYRKAVQIDPHCYECLGDLGDILRQQGKFDEALTYMLRAKTCPEDAKFPGQADKFIEMCRHQRKEASN